MVWEYESIDKATTIWFIVSRLTARLLYRDTRILGHYLRDFVRAMWLAIAMVFFSATEVQGSKGATLSPWKLYNATPFEVSFIFWETMNLIVVA